MEVKSEASKNPGAKEFEALLKEDLKKRDLKEGNIIKATISEIGKKYVFVDLKAKSEGIIPIEEFKNEYGTFLNMHSYHLEKILKLNTNDYETFYPSLMVLMTHLNKEL